MDCLEGRMCQKHNKILELFCQTDQVCVCVLCKMLDHMSHPVVTLKEEHEVKVAPLGQMKSQAQQMIQERQQKIQEIEESVELSKVDVDRVLGGGVQILAALNGCIEKCWEDLNQRVFQKLKSTEEESDGLIKQLQREIEDLTRRSSEVTQLTQTEDHLHFLQTFRSLQNPAHTRDWKTVEVLPLSNAETLMRSLDELEETLSKEIRKVSLLKTTLKKYARELKLDPNTAYRMLALSDDDTKAAWVRETEYLDHPDRFDSCSQVLCSEGLTGCCYWEVEWEGGVAIGVTYRGIPRRGRNDERRLGGNDKSWSLHCDAAGYCARFKGTEKFIRLPPAGSNRVGVYLDRPAGSLSFYRVSPDVGGSSDTLTHIHTFRSTFTQEDLLPGFGILWPGSSATLMQ